MVQRGGVTTLALPEWRILATGGAGGWFGLQGWLCTVGVGDVVGR